MPPERTVPASDEPLRLEDQRSWLSHSAELAHRARGHGYARCDSESRPTRPTSSARRSRQSLGSRRPRARRRVAESFRRDGEPSGRPTWPRALPRDATADRERLRRRRSSRRRPNRSTVFGGGADPALHRPHVVVDPVRVRQPRRVWVCGNGSRAPACSPLGFADGAARPVQVRRADRAALTCRRTAVNSVSAASAVPAASLASSANLCHKSRSCR